MKYLEDLTITLTKLMRDQEFDDPLMRRHVSPHFTSKNDADSRFSANSRDEHMNHIRQHSASNPGWDHTTLDVRCSHADHESAEVWITHNVVGLFQGDGSRVARQWINRIEWRKQMRLDVDEPVWTAVSMTGMHGMGGMGSGD